MRSCWRFSWTESSPLNVQASRITASSVIIRQASQVKAQRTTLDQIPGQRLRGGHVAAGQPPGRGKAKRNIQLNRDRKTVTRGRPRAGPIFEFPREEDSGLDDQTLKERLAGGRRINCETVEERCLATNLLLKMGYRHGKDRVFQEILRSVEPGQVIYVPLCF